MKLIDSQYLEHRQMAVWLVRLCYPIARSIEEKQPATTLKFLEAGFAARHEIAELAIGLQRNAPERKIKRAVAALKCVRAILVRLSQQDPVEAARITAATEVAERLIAMLEKPA